MVSDMESAMKIYQQVLTIVREIGHLSAEAIFMNEIAIQLLLPGKHALLEQIENLP